MYKYYCVLQIIAFTKPSNLNTLILSLSYEHDQYKLMNIGFVNVYFQVNKILKLN